LFNIGDSVVHPKHGSGVVTKRRTLQSSSGEREYFCIELVDGRGSVMIPIDRLEEAGLREPLQDIYQIQQIMEMPPDILVDDIHVRQTAIEGKLSSGDAHSLVEVLRDLSWRETVLHLSPTDKKLKEGALSKILQELGLNRRLVIATTRQNIETIIHQAMQRHLAKLEPAAAAGEA
jgi:CarD family transcriptional regulator